MRDNRSFKNLRYSTKLSFDLLKRECCRNKRSSFVTKDKFKRFLNQDK